VDSGDKLEMLRSLGATEVIDYTAEDFTRTGKTYDVIFDVVGKTPLGRAMRSLTDMGTYLLANPSIWRMLRGWWMARTSQRRFVAAAARRTVEELVFLKELAEAGELRTIIDRRYPLEQMAEAHAYVESGRKAGNVVVTVAEPQSPLDP